MSTYVHNIDPFAIQFTETFGIRWYGLAYLFGFVACYLLAYWMKTRSKIGLEFSDMSDFVFYSALGAVIGGRLGYCTLYRPELLTQFDASFPFWAVLAVHQGGMASHGGILGVITAGFIFARIRKLSFLHILDLTALGAGIGITMGRTANFINGELVGRVCENTQTWCVKFPQDLYSYSATQLSELTAAVGSVGVSAESWKNMIGLGPYQLQDPEKTNQVISLLILEIQKGNELVRSLVGQELLARYPSQLYAAFFEGFLIFLVLFALWAKPRLQGVLASGFLIIYALGRIFDEQFRLPDAHLGFQLFGLTRGQWLSVGTFFIGIALYLYSRRSGLERLGGWYKARTK